MSTAGRFRHDWLPSWPRYSQLQGLALPDSGRTEQRMPCTIHGGEQDNLCVNIMTGAWQCKACGAAGGDVLAHYRAVHGASFREAAVALGAWDDDSGNRPVAAPATPPKAATAIPEQRADEAWKLQRAAGIWQTALPITPDAPIAAYFTVARGVPLPPDDGDLRWVPDLCLFGFGGPALVGRMSLARDYRQMRGLHLTWLHCEAGVWRRVERRYLGAKKECVVRLWPDEEVSQGLGVAEGIETALALAHAYRPVWACLDAGNLAQFPMLPGIGSLLVAADHDPAGIAAARACAQRWADADKEAAVVMSATPRHDINDLALEPEVA